ncbi:unnamed protein product [Penicillium pancosmium]
MAEWAALGAVAEAVGAVIAAYGTYQDVFGPAKQEIDWNKYIVASEKRIIRDSDRKIFKDYYGNIMTVSEWWEGTCAEILKKHPISPENMSLFDRQIGDSLGDRLQTLERAIYYLSHDAPGDYGTYGALVTAHSLNFILLAVKESASFASAKKDSGSPALRLAISSAIEDIKAWPARYYLERPTHLTTEIEEKYSGGGGPLGRPGEKHRTGWWTLHDDTNDPPVGTFEGERFFRIYPVKSELVKERYRNSEVATSALPKIVGEWETLLKQAVQAEQTIHWTPIESTTVVLPRA